VNIGVNPGINLNTTTAAITTFNHNEPTRGRVNFTRFSAHTLGAKKLDITGRIVYSKSKSDFNFIENFTGVNWNSRVSGWPPGPLAQTPNILNLAQYRIPGTTERPQYLGDIGFTFLATDKLRISNSFKVEDFKIRGSAVLNDFFSVTRGSGSSLRTDTIGFTGLDAHRTTEYRKYQNTIEGDYQFNPRYSVHFGYRYGSRRIRETFEGFDLGSNGSVSSPPTRSSEDEVDSNHTHALFGGFKARPASNWTVYFDAARGTADAIFSRIRNDGYHN